MTDYKPTKEYKCMGFLLALTPFLIFFCYACPLTAFGDKYRDESGEITWSPDIWNYDDDYREWSCGSSANSFHVMSLISFGLLGLVLCLGGVAMFWEADNV